MYNQYYAGLIWTHHVLERLTDRGMTQDIVAQTITHPDKSFPGKQPGSTQYEKRFDKRTITAIVKPNEKRELVIISAWMDPPLEWTKDAKKKKEYWAYQKAPEWKKWLLTLKKMLGF